MRRGHQGAIGYAFQQTLQNELFKRGIKKNAVATVVTQMLVDQNDPAFKNPTKPIGSFMDEAEAKRREKEMGWTVVEDAGRGWRRVVAFAAPQGNRRTRIGRDSDRCRRTVVITVGGGGIPVIDAGEWRYIRRSRRSSTRILPPACWRGSIKADLFLISTAVEKVAINFGKPDQKWLDKMTLAEAKQYLAEGTHFAKGSMAPKIQAILWYLEAGGKQALITNPENIGRALKGETGTLIVP